MGEEELQEMLDRVEAGEDPEQVIHEALHEGIGLRDIATFIGGVLAGRTLFKRQLHSMKDVAASLLACREFLAQDKRFYTRPGVLQSFDFLIKLTMKIGEG